METEETIREGLAKNIPTSEPELNGWPKDDKQSDFDAFHNNHPIEATLAKYELIDYFNLGRGALRSPETQAQLNSILEWAVNNTSEKDMAGVLKMLRQTETSLGNRLKSDRLPRLYRFVRIQQQKRLLDEQEANLYA